MEIAIENARDAENLLNTHAVYRVWKTALEVHADTKQINKLAEGIEYEALKDWGEGTTVFLDSKTKIAIISHPERDKRIFRK